jgi:hypothetical protein
MKSFWLNDSSGRQERWAVDGHRWVAAEPGRNKFNLWGYQDAAAARRLHQAGMLCPSLEDWPQDAMRHTFASMHYAAFKHAAETAEQMGHSRGLRVFFRHYRSRIKETDARAFWQLQPSSSFSNRPSRPAGAN